MNKTKQAPVSRACTSADVARRAGVSRTTVSYVLNGVQDAHVSEETRQKVLQAAQELEYHPHPSAQTLRKGSNNELAMVSTLPMSLNDAEMVGTFQLEALLHGFLPVTYHLGNMDEEEQAAIYPKILARRPDALFGYIDALSSKIIALAHQMGIEHIIMMSAEPFTTSDPVSKFYPAYLANRTPGSPASSFPWSSQVGHSKAAGCPPSRCF